ncbi:c-type cytochrome [Rhizobium lusitanum]|uniref:C-type cytochrome n=1 Tax=Rhizobium lusitanum TaxID=293958 RepID=A0A6L9UA49_9HYPH|nr:cytochrome c [Rhizobium lusitanum]NEI72434.1 c-type cytochrome [Rhizobium lusitanum]
MRIRITRLLGAVIALGAVGALGAWVTTIAFGNIGGDKTASLGVAVTPELIQRGAYVAKLGDCAACHTAPGGKDFAGGLPLQTPIGAVFSTNITPDKTNGIGGYTYGEFERAVRRGMLPDGTSLYPAMPFPSYAKISDDDMKALYAFFTKGVAPVAQKNRSADIPWPLSMRWPLTYWRWVFGPRVETQTVAQTSAADPLLARGAYLVEGLGHCGSCHTPRGIGLEEKALSASDGPNYLSDGFVDNHVANNLRGDPVTGLGTWSEDDIVQFLQTGRNSKSAAFGGMADVVSHSTQFMRDDDLRAIARYLKSLPPDGSPREATDSDRAGKDKTQAMLAAADVSKPGALDYLNNCAACHLSSGRGYRDTFPALAANPVVNATDPTSVIHIIMQGATIPRTLKAPTDFTMPGFADRLTDKEIADLATFVRSSWGNNAPAVSPDQVAKLRATIDAARPPER